jgi:hypothetical protein
MPSTSVWDLVQGSDSIKYQVNSGDFHHDSIKVVAFARLYNRLGYREQLITADEVRLRTCSSLAEKRSLIDRH